MLPWGRNCLLPAELAGKGSVAAGARHVRQTASLPRGRMAHALARLSSRGKRGWAVGEGAQHFSLWTGFIPACRGPGARDWHVEPQRVGSWHWGQSTSFPL